MNPPSSFNLVSQSELSKNRKHHAKLVAKGVRSSTDMAKAVKPKKIKNFYSLMAKGGFIADLGEYDKKTQERPWHVKKANANYDSDSS